MLRGGHQNIFLGPHTILVTYYLFLFSFFPPLSLSLSRSLSLSIPTLFPLISHFGGPPRGRGPRARALCARRISQACQRADLKTNIVRRYPLCNYMYRYRYLKPQSFSEYPCTSDLADSDSFVQIEVINRTSTTLAQMIDRQVYDLHLRSRCL